MWIPYKTKPKISDVYIVAWKPDKVDIGMKHFYGLWNYDKETDEFELGEIAKEWGEENIEILAWMELPKEYQEELNDANS